MGLEGNLRPIHSQTISTVAPSRSKTLELSTNLHQRFLESFSDVPGWFYPESAAIWDTLLSYQTARNVYGNRMEIGVFQGKSAAMAALHSRGEETCILVDSRFPP